MPRSGDNARLRLRDAALELVSERGYDAVTAAQIAARAGVTERTFFRHFPDKREALFDGEEAFRETLRGAVLAAPPDRSPLGAVLLAFASVEQLLTDNRPFAVTRAAILAKTPALQERMLTKTAGLATAMAEALQRRGVEAGAARLAAQVGMAAFSYAADAWGRDPKPGLAHYLAQAFEELQGLSSARRG
jgi:AcrR family transcriptional regulator